jgi:hypothetical protein
MHVWSASVWQQSEACLQASMSFEHDGTVGAPHTLAVQKPVQQSTPVMHA